MKCHETQRIIDNIGDMDRLPIAANRHLQTCEDCTRFGYELVELRALLGEPGRVQAPPDFDARLADRLSLVRAKKSVSFWTFRNEFALTLTALLLVFVSGTILRSQPESVIPQPIKTANSNASLEPPALPPTPIVKLPSGIIPSDRSANAPPTRIFTVNSSSRRVQLSRPQEAIILVSVPDGDRIVRVPTVVRGTQPILDSTVNATTLLAKGTSF